MGLEFSKEIEDAVPKIASYRNDISPLLRERALNALGRIGRADYGLIEEYWQDLFFLPKIPSRRSG